jgi:16S rRNA (adenine1518-N6/adenine1519-N6)-dimethyltransferase
MSAVVHITPKDAASGVKMSVLENLTGAAFGQRRKMLRQSLKGVPGALEALHKTCIAEDRRPESINIAEWCALAREVG